MATTPKKNSDKSLIEILADIIDGPGSPEEDPEREARVAEAEHAAVMRKNEERDAAYIGQQQRREAAAEAPDEMEPQAAEDEGFASALEKILQPEVADEVGTARSVPEATPVEPTTEEAPVEEMAAEVAEAEEPVDEAVLAKDFQVTHGGAFDPNSSADAAKMAQIRKARAQNPKASPTQLALMIYRNQV